MNFEQPKKEDANKEISGEAERKRVGETTEINADGLQEKNEELTKMKLKEELNWLRGRMKYAKKIESGELEAIAEGMMSKKEKILSGEREQLLKDLEFWTKEDPVRLAKAVKSVSEFGGNSQTSDFFERVKINYHGKNIEIKKEDTRNAAALRVEMKNGRSFSAGSADLRLNKGLLAKLNGTDWIRDDFLRLPDGTRWDSMDDSSDELRKNTIAQWRNKAYLIKKLLDHENQEKDNKMLTDK